MNDLFTIDSAPALIDLKTAWKSVMERIEAEVGKEATAKFLAPLTPQELKGTRLTVHARSKFHQQWVQAKYQPRLEQYLEDELGRPITLELELVPQDRAERQDDRTDKDDPVALDHTPKAPVHRFESNPRYTFESFVVGQSNRLAMASAKAVADQPGGRFNPLFIYGPSGLGKTHLLHAIAGAIATRQPGLNVEYLTAQQFAEEFIQALQHSRVESWRRQQRSAGILLVDDMQFIVGKDKTQEEFFHTFNLMFSSGRQMVLTADRPPRDLYGMDERLRSRFESGLVADVQMPDTETRIAIVLSKAEQAGIRLPQDVATVLAEGVPGNIRQLEGAFNKVVAYASLDGQPLDVELARLIVERDYQSVRAKPKLGTILEVVSQHYKIPVEDILGQSRKAPIVKARHVAVYMTRRITEDSWKHIGHQFGDRDHTSMLHGYQKIEKELSEDHALKATIQRLMHAVMPEG